MTYWVAVPYLRCVFQPLSQAVTHFRGIQLSSNCLSTVALPASLQYEERGGWYPFELPKSGATAKMQVFPFIFNEACPFLLRGFLSQLVF